VGSGKGDFQLLGFHSFLSYLRSRAPANPKIEVSNPMVQDSDVELFVWLGLTEFQAKIYLTLFEIGENDAGTIARLTQIAPAGVQDALEVLHEIGLVQKVTVNKSPFLVSQTNSPKRKK
jgi:hypothetical protein